jgi:hypothetical protein
MQNINKTSRPKKIDREFLAAFDHFLRTRGWTAQRFSQLSADHSMDGRPIHPNQVTKWRAGLAIPTTETVTTACRTFGVKRSYFFFIGEQLAELEALDEAPSKRLVKVIQSAISDMDNPFDRQLLDDLGNAVRRQLSAPANEGR